MKLYWLKRLALKWLVNDEDFYFIMTALRGPDIDAVHFIGDTRTDRVIKQQSTARIRYKAGLCNPSGTLRGATIDDGEPLSIHDMKDVVIEGTDENRWYHFNSHIKIAIAALRKAGYK